MGYITKDIAQITEPKVVSLAGAPNFVQFASKAAAKTYIDVDVTVNATQDTPIARTTLRVYEANGTVHEFHGTTDPEAVGGSTFYVATDPSDTAENLRQALVSNSWMDANFEVRIPSVINGTNIANGRALSIRGKGAGQDFRLNITAPADVANSAYTITWVSDSSTDGDTIKGNASAVELELDVYEDADIFLGADDRPLDEARLGRKTVSLQKTYTGAPVWFDVNALFANYGAYNKPTSGWFATGTAKVFRFVAKVRSFNSFTFYQSSALFAINGFSRLSEPIDMGAFIYGNGVARPLSAAPTVPYVRGQAAFLNFIYSDPQRGQSAPVYPAISVAYKVLTRGGNFLATVLRQATTGAALFVVNTVRLQLDEVLDLYPTAGEVHVTISQGGADMTEPLKFRILPDCLHELRDFTFLNKWGGWEVFNFDADERRDVSRSAETYNRTNTPQSSGGNEHVYAVSVTDTVTIEGAPVSDAVAEWLMEFAASRVIFDRQGRQIIIEDFTLSVSPTAENMQVPTMKYRLNDTYTNG